MKKLSVFVIIIALLALSLSASVFAVELPLRIVFSGDKVIYGDVKPFVDGNGAVQIPATEIKRTVGADVQIESSTNTVIVTLKEKKLTIAIGKDTYDLNGKQYPFTKNPIIKDGNIFIPLELICKALNFDTEYEEDINTWYIVEKKDDTTSKGSSNGTKQETEKIAGFIVPKDANVAVIYPPSDKRVEVWFALNFLVQDFPKQISDLEKILIQKCDKRTVNLVISHIKQKTERATYLPEKFIYDKKSKRCIWIDNSFFDDVNVYFCSLEHSKLYSKIDVKTYYDDVEFDEKTDIDKYGRMSVSASQDFMNRIWMVFYPQHENNNCLRVYGTYPYLPKEFKVFLDIKIYKTDGSTLHYYSGNKDSKYDVTNGQGSNISITIPNTYKKNIKSIVVTSEIRSLVFKGDSKMSNTLVKRVITSNPRSAKFVPTTKGAPASTIKDFNYKRMFEY